METRRGADHGEGVGVVFHVGGEHGGDDLYLAPPCLGKKGPDGPVRLAAGQDGGFRGAAFPSNESAGDFPAA